VSQRDSRSAAAEAGSHAMALLDSMAGDLTALHEHLVVLAEWADEYSLPGESGNLSALVRVVRRAGWCRREGDSGRRRAQSLRTVRGVRRAGAGRVDGLASGVGCV
jgi:hypothetical protein